MYLVPTAASVYAKGSEDTVLTSEHHRISKGGKYLGRCLKI